MSSAAQERDKPESLGLLPAEALDGVASRFRVLSSASRLRILNALMEGPRSMGELVELTSLEQSNLSRHVALLERGGCVARHREGQHKEHKPRHPRLRGHSTHVTENPETIPNNVCCLFENLREVTTSFPLQNNGGDKQMEFFAIHAAGEFLEGVFHVEPKTVFLKKNPEFLGHWIRRLIRHDLDRAGQRQTRSQGPV